MKEFWFTFLEDCHLKKKFQHDLTQQKAQHESTLFRKLTVHVCHLALWMTPMCASSWFTFALLHIVAHQIIANIFHQNFTKITFLSVSRFTWRAISVFSLSGSRPSELMSPPPVILPLLEEKKKYYL